MFKYGKVGTIWLVILIATHLQCVNNCSKVVQFELPIHIFPHLDTYHKGDTIWLEFIVPQTMMDIKTGDPINIGFHEFEIGVNVVQLLDTNWVSGTGKLNVVKDMGDFRIVGQTYPEIVLTAQINEIDQTQGWRVGLIPLESNIDLMLYIRKRNFSGEHFFPEDDCIYGIGESFFNTNSGSIDYETYVDRFPFYTSGLSADPVEDHRKAGAYHIHVE